MIGKYRIGVCGTHSVGKTTLVEALNKVLDYPLITEIAAKFPRAERQHLKTQLDIMSAQIAAEIEAQHFLSDRTVIDNLAYTTLCFTESIRDVGGLDEIFIRVKEYMAIVGLGTEYLAGRPYDLIIFVDELLPIEDNGSRCLNERYQEWIYNFIKTEVGVVGNNHRIPVLDVRGSTEVRVKLITESLKNMDGKLSRVRLAADAKKLRM